MTDAAHEPGLAAPARRAAAGVRRAEPRPAGADRRDRHRRSGRTPASPPRPAMPAARRRACSISRSRAAQAPRRGCRSRGCSARQAPTAACSSCAARPASAFWVDVAFGARRPAASSGRSPTSPRQRALAARAARQDELLDTAQEFGRLGIWEREIPSGEGRWDKHVFGFWGIDPAEGTPHHDDAIAAHPSRGSRAHGLPRVDAPRRPLRAALSRHPARRQRRAGSTRSGR